MMCKYFAQSQNEAIVAPAEHMRYENAQGARAFCGKIREIYCYQLPSDIGRIVGIAHMDTFDNRVMRDDKRLLAELDDCSIVFQAASFGRFRQCTKRGDECVFR